MEDVQLLLLVLLSGYCFLATDTDQHNRSIRESGYRLYLRIAACGVIFVSLGAVAHAMLLSLELYRFFLVLLERVVKFAGLAPGAVSVFILSLIIGWLAANLRRPSTWPSMLSLIKEVSSSNELSQTILWSITDEPKMLMFTISTGKVYVGYVDKYDVSTSGDSDQWLRIVLVLSGFRDSDQGVDLNIAYDPSTVSDPAQFHVVIPLSQIVSVHPFDPDVYKNTSFQSSLGNSKVSGSPNLAD